MLVQNINTPTKKPNKNAYELHLNEANIEKMNFHDAVVAGFVDLRVFGDCGCQRSEVPDEDHKL